MTHWRFSSFSAAFGMPNGELIVCNSFMGALSRILPHAKSLVLAAIETGIPEERPTNPILRRLCERGYFVGTDTDEERLADAILTRERDETSFHLILMPHENCNFRCTYCYERFERGRMKPRIVDALKRLVERQAPQWTSLRVGWFGGEPLLASDLIAELSDAFIASCTSNGIRYTSNITTNGYLLELDVARMLLDRHVSHFQITLDGPAQTHDARRRLASGRGSYSKVLRNLLGLQRLTDPFTVHIRVNFDADSIGLIERWLGELAPAFAHDERFSFQFHRVWEWGQTDHPRAQVCDHVAAQNAKLDFIETAMAEGLSVGPLRNFFSSHGNACYAAKASSIIVGTDGRLYKCTVAFDDERNHVGTISPSGRLEIDRDRWNQWIGTDALDTRSCASCWFRPSCESRSCPHEALNRGKPICPTNPDEVRALVELSAYGRRLTRPRPAAPVRSASNLSEGASRGLPVVQAGDPAEGP